MKESAIKEAVKEFCRVIALATLPVLIVLIEQPGSSWRAGIITVVVAALKAIDKYIHEDPTTSSKGLLPF